MVVVVVVAAGVVVVVAAVAAAAVVVAALLKTAIHVCGSMSGLSVFLLSGIWFWVQAVGIRIPQSSVLANPKP